VSKSIKQPATLITIEKGKSEHMLFDISSSLSFQLTVPKAIKL